MRRGEVTHERPSDAGRICHAAANIMHVRAAYGLLISGTSMEPEFRSGDTALVHPHLPVIAGEAYVFFSERDGEAHATIRRLRRATTDKWFVVQWNPAPGKKREHTLSRKEWKWAHRVVGKYCGP
jgi:phage repressor protein C with HTH and peptisase S24 domain